MKTQLLREPSAVCAKGLRQFGRDFGAAVGLRSLLEEFVPAILDWCQRSTHTLAGKKLGRGLEHFRQEGAKLIPTPTGDDPYIDEAYRLWAIKQ